MLLAANLLAMALVKLVPEYHADLAILAILAGSLIATYTLRALIWLLVGRRYQLSFVYPLMGLNYILSMVVGIAGFGERFSSQRLVGALVILLGVFIVSKSGHREDVYRDSEA